MDIPIRISPTATNFAARSPNAAWRRPAYLQGLGHDAGICLPQRAVENGLAAVSAAGLNLRVVSLVSPIDAAVGVADDSELLAHPAVRAATGRRCQPASCTPRPALPEPRGIRLSLLIQARRSTISSGGSPSARAGRSFLPRDALLGNRRHDARRFAPVSGSRREFSDAIRDRRVLRELARRNSRNPGHNDVGRMGSCRYDETAAIPRARREAQLASRSRLL
jgi:hypothetical protein